MVGRYDAILIQQRISIILNGYKRINYNRVPFLKSVVSVFGEATGVSQGSCDVIAVHLITIHFGQRGYSFFSFDMHLLFHHLFVCDTSVSASAQAESFQQMQSAD